MSGDFLDHELDRSPEAEPKEKFPIPCPSKDKPIPFARSVSEFKSAAAYKTDLEPDFTNVVPRLNYFHNIAKSKWHLAFILEDEPVRRRKAKGPIPGSMDYVDNSDDLLRPR